MSRLILSSLEEWNSIDDSWERPDRFIHWLHSRTITSMWSFTLSAWPSCSKSLLTPTTTQTPFHLNPQSLLFELRLLDQVEILLLNGLFILQVVGVLTLEITQVAFHVHLLLDQLFKDSLVLWIEILDSFYWRRFQVGVLPCRLSFLSRKEEWLRLESKLLLLLKIILFLSRLQRWLAYRWSWNRILILVACLLGWYLDEGCSTDLTLL